MIGSTLLAGKTLIRALRALFLVVFHTNGPFPTLSPNIIFGFLILNFLLTTLTNLFHKKDIMLLDLFVRL